MRKLTFREVEIGYPRCKLLYEIDGTLLTKHVNVKSLPAAEFCAADSVTLRHLLAHVGMAYVPHLFVLDDFDTVNVYPLYLSPAGIDFYETYIQHGLAELRMRNGLPVDKPVRIKLPEDAPQYRPQFYGPNRTALLMNGGGKDTVVAAELLREIALPFEWLTLGITPAMKRLVQVSGNPRLITLRLGGSLRAISARTRYRGHKPFSSVLAALGLLAAFVRRHRYIVVANEYSANFGNVWMDGLEVNHQYPKSHEFELRFAAYVKSEILPEASYFSVLRPLYDIQIAKLFASYPQYFESFRSCNIGHQADYWCLKCPKCAFVALALAPHIDKARLQSIFGQDPLALPRMRRLIARLCGPNKPFECVGTQGESMMALWMARGRHPHDRFIESLCESRCSGTNMAAQEREYMHSFDRPHSIPAELADAVMARFEDRLQPNFAPRNPLSYEVEMWEKRKRGGSPDMPGFRDEDFVGGNGTNWLQKKIAKRPAPRLENIWVMIVNPYEDPERFARSHMGKVLLWGLKRKRIEWVLHNPARLKFDPDRFDAVLCWPYGFRQNPDFLPNCAVFERRARDCGLPVINGLAGCDLRHTWCLRLWKARGVECPTFQTISGWRGIRLNYPIILRTDHLHLGLNMHLARAPEEARRVLRRDISPPLDLAIEFIDTRGTERLYRKWRSHVIGDKVIPRQVQLSSRWKVNLQEAQRCEQSVEENREFLAQGEPHPKLVAFAAKTLNADIIALDYAKKSDGTYVFWEGNRNFDLSIDGQMWSQFRSTTGLSNEACVDTVRAIGDGIADLIVERAQRLDG